MQINRLWQERLYLKLKNLLQNMTLKNNSLKAFSNKISCSVGHKFYKSTITIKKMNFTIFSIRLTKKSTFLNHLFLDVLVWFWQLDLKHQKANWSEKLLLMHKIWKFNKKMVFGLLAFCFSVLLSHQLMFLIKEWIMKKEANKNCFWDVFLSSQLLFLHNYLWFWH